MLIGFGYLYKFAMFFPYFFQKAENNRFEKRQLAKLSNIIFLFLLKMESVKHVDQQNNLVSSSKLSCQIDYFA